MVSITIHGGAGEVGGNKILVEDGGTRVLLDFGRSMGESGKFYEEYIQVRAKSALLDLLKLRILPQIDGIYQREFLDIGALRWDGAELATSLPLDEAADYWMRPTPLPYNHEKPSLDAVFVSHAHFDHIQDVSFLDNAIPVICTDVTRVLARAITDISRGGGNLKFFEADDFSKIRMRVKSPWFSTVFPGSLEMKTEDAFEEAAERKSGYIMTVDAGSVERPYVTEQDGHVGSMRYRIVPVGHSIPGAASTLLTTPDGKRILYTGDIRFHGRGETTLDDYVMTFGPGIDVMLCEGTRIESTKDITENDVASDIAARIRATKGLALVDFGWKDTTRFDTIAAVARETGRIFVINPKMAFLLSELHFMDPARFPDPRDMEHVKVYKERCVSLLYSNSEYTKHNAGYLHNWGKNTSKTDKCITRIAEKLGVGGDPKAPKGKLSSEEEEAWDLATHHIRNGLPAFEIRKNPGKYILMFSFWDANELMDLSTPEGNMPGAAYIRASCEPFNDEMEIDEGKLMNWLDRFGISYDTEMKDGNTHFKRAHVSGHASRPELKELISKLKPKVLIPIHTPRPDLFEAMVREIEAETGHRIDLRIPAIGSRYEF
jgi:ribonuclease J